MEKRTMNKELIQLINDHDEIMLLTHVSPDGDALGSTFALNAYLKDLGKKTYVVHNDQVPSNLMIVANDEIYTEEAFDGLGVNPTLVFSMDSGDEGRLGTRVKYLESRTSICIDHHITNVGFCDYNYLDSKASSTGELLYELLFTDDMPVSKTVASAIYVAILMDTGGFRYSNTSSRTMEVVAKLFAAGINYVDLNIEVYQNVPVNKFKMTNLILGTLELSHDNRVGFVYITEDMLKAKGLELDDTDGVIENVRDIDSVEVALFIKEVAPNIYKGSARSKRFYDVSSYCMQFGGGGHVHAAGFTIEGSFEEIKERMLNAIEFK